MSDKIGEVIAIILYILYSTIFTGITITIILSCFLESFKKYHKEKNKDKQNNENKIEGGVMNKELKEDIVLEFANYIKSKLFDLGNVVMPEDVSIMASEFLGGDNENDGSMED